MKRTVVLLIVAVLMALYLGNGAMAFNSPISPIATVYWPPPSNHIPHTPTPVPTMILFVPTVTPFIPISPIIFNSPIATPEAICVAVGHWGQILCY